MSELIQGSIYNAEKASIGTSAVALSSSTQLLCSNICIKALAGNTGTVFVGASGVTTANGFPLYPGDSVTIEAKRPSYVYVIASASPQEVRWIAN